MRTSQIINLIMVLLISGSVAEAQTSSQVVGFGLGMSTGTVTTDIGKNIEKIETVGYSAIAFSTFTNFDLSPKMSAEFGAEILMLLASAQSNQTLSKGGYGAFKYHVLGGAHLVSEGSKSLSVSKSSSSRVSIPVYLKYQNIDFSVDSEGSKTPFSGALLEIATGVQAERDFGKYILGGTVTKTFSTILISSKSTKIDALSLILSGKIYF